MKILKVFLKIIGGFILLIGMGIFLMYHTVTSINKEYEPKENIINGGEKQALLIYEPSISSLTEDASLKIADVMNKKGYTVTINYPSDELKYDLDKYDTIVFGSPVFAGKVSPVLEEYIERNSIENKKVIVYTTGKFSNKKDE